MNSEEIMSALRQIKEAVGTRQEASSQWDVLWKQREDDLNKWLAAHPLTAELKVLDQVIRNSDEVITSADDVLVEASWAIYDFLNAHCPEDEFVSDVCLKEGGIHLTVEQYGDELIEGRDRVVSNVHRSVMSWDDFWQYVILKTLSE